jgi:uncharacterized protein YdeI (YjbR/CyaY-like superfamily)
MNKMNPLVDEYLNSLVNWKKEFEGLRKIILETELTEGLKWGVPCYTLSGNNVVLIHGFKEYCAVLFIKGALLKDLEGILIRQTENVQAGRQIRFTNFKEITEKEAVLKSYLEEAIEIEKSGFKVHFETPSEIVRSQEFVKVLTDNPALKSAFESLTPGRMKAYDLFFSAPKQTKTRNERIQKCIPKILSGKGLND